ncbi:hypothetical protein J6590_069401 [Homalodisca vitripennis]|nr:hypothetical protein J6590_069401 [Homalodisca vitripennis]
MSSHAQKGPPSVSRSHRFVYSAACSYLHSWRKILIEHANVAIDVSREFACCHAVSRAVAVVWSGDRASGRVPSSGGDIRRGWHHSGGRGIFIPPCVK